MFRFSFIFRHLHIFILVFVFAFVDENVLFSLIALFVFVFVNKSNTKYTSVWLSGMLEYEDLYQWSFLWALINGCFVVGISIIRVRDGLIHVFISTTTIINLEILRHLSRSTQGLNLMGNRSG